MGLFGGNTRSAPRAKDRNPVRVVKKFFMGEDFNQASEFLGSIGIAVDRDWGCIHNLASCEGVHGGTLYVCPGSNHKPDYDAIMAHMQAHEMRVIHLIELDFKSMMQ